MSITSDELADKVVELLEEYSKQLAPDRIAIWRRLEDIEARLMRLKDTEERISRTLSDLCAQQIITQQALHEVKQCLKVPE